MNRVIAWCCVVVATALPSCAYMQLDPEARSIDFKYSAPFVEAPFETAAIVVNGEVFTIDSNVPGIALGGEKHQYRGLVDALREKEVFARLAEAGEAPDLEIECGFRLEDDVNPLHRSVSMLTLYTFPFWKMVRLSVRAEVRAKGHRFDGFWFEDEVEVYVSPILLPGALFFGRPGPEQRLAEEAGRALAMHVIRAVRRSRVPTTCPPVEAEPAKTQPADSEAQP